MEVIMLVYNVESDTFVDIHKSTSDNFEFPFLSLEFVQLYESILYSNSISLHYIQNGEMKFFKGRFKGLSLYFDNGLKLDLPILFDNLIHRILLNLKIRVFQLLFMGTEPWHQRIVTKRIRFWKYHPAKFAEAYFRKFITLIVSKVNTKSGEDFFVLLKYSKKSLDKIDLLCIEENIILTSSDYRPKAFSNIFVENIV